MSAVGTRGNTKSFLAPMTVNAIVNFFTEFSDHIGVAVSFFDTSDNFVENANISLAGISLLTSPWPFITSAISTYATGEGNTVASVVSQASMNAVVHSFSNPTRVVNTAYQPSTTADTLVIGSVEIDATLSLSGGTKGTVTLQYADDSGFTTNVKTAGIGVNGNTGTLTIGLNTVGAGGGPIAGVVPKSKYYRYLTASSTGTATFTVLSTQEVSL